MRPAHDRLVVYLNDHLAGSLTVIDLLDHLIQTQADKARVDFLVYLQGEVMADRRTLEGLMQRIAAGQHPHRQAVAWLAEKVARLKLHLDSAQDGALLWLEALEFVGIGIHGKRALWRALAVAAEQQPLLQGLDYEHQVQRAEEQSIRVETVRLEAVRTALASATLPG